LNTLKLRDVLSGKSRHDGWLYMPSRPWGLDTECVFVQSDKDAEPGSKEHLPDSVVSGGWQPILDSESIEDIIFNAEDQLGSPTMNQLLNAFLYYVENDAFLEF
jgi:hypothetical protein